MSSILHLVGGKIRDIRKSAGLSQEELSEKAGFHITYIGGVERGERNLSLENLEQIASALEVEIYELFSYVKEARIINSKDKSLQDLLSLMVYRDEKEINMAVSLLNTIFQTYKT